MQIKLPQQVKNYFHLVKAVAANIYFKRPSKNLKIIGITGTDGKTTTCFYLYNILRAAGKNVAVISTIEARFNDQIVDTGLHVTNPDSWELQKLLRKISDDGVEYVVLEVTSHGIDQFRIWGIQFVVTGLTNITHEHLDYHHTFEEYRRVKMNFVNSAPFHFLSEEINDETIANYQINLPGDYNVKNAKLAAAIARQLEIDEDCIRKGIETLTELAGRMNVVYDRSFRVVVDFAHTPNGLENSLTSAKQKAISQNGRLISVFGAAGERDALKRPVMGEIAGRIADLIVITSEDPRSEKPDDIALQIAAGVEKSGKVRKQNFWIITNRRKAIEFALRALAKEHDIVLLTGKGHEKSMNINGTEYPWDDRQVVSEILE